MVYKLDELQLLNGQDGVIVLQNIISHTRGLDIIRVGLPVKTFNAMLFLWELYTIVTKTPCRHPAADS
ncbi:MAG: hypothetical protein OXF73_10340, partial [Gammaproteobacteria bacterium]|nr:hypothetical protein [Gammaproteobacteria bacterium]